MLKFRYFILLLLFYLIELKLDAQVTADFKADTTSGCGSAAVNFTDLSTGNITSWNWTFGNGNTSTNQNPTANYTIVNSYDVTLTVSDGTNSDSKTITNYINVYRNPTANFTLSPITGCSPLEVIFTNTSSNGSAPINQYIWDFSDGSQPNSTKDPTHSYQTGGTYPPSLQVVDQNGCSDIKVYNDVVVTTAPTAAFSTAKSPLTCADTLTVDFIDNSLGSGLTYKWLFGDGQTSTQASPRHFYNSLGKYDVTLIVSDTNCSDTLFLKEYVRLESTTAKFTPEKDRFCIEEEIDFYNQSSGASIYRWDFGDGTSSTKSDPKKTYQDSGYFEVKLTVSAGAICLKTYRDTVYVQQVIADFSTSPTFGCNPEDTITFTNTSTNADSAIWKLQLYYGNDSSELIYTAYSPPTLKWAQYASPGLNYFNDTLISISSLGCADTLVKDSNRATELLRTNIQFDSKFNKVVDLYRSGMSSNIVGGCAPLAVDFTDSTTGPGTIVSWDWDFGISKSSLEIPPTTNYTDDTLRQVSLKVTNNLGCTAVDTIIAGAGFKQTPQFTITADSICPFEDLLVFDKSIDSTKVNYWEFNFWGIYNSENFFSILDTINDTTGVKAGTRLLTYPDTGSYRIIQIIGHNGCEVIDTSDVILYVFGPIAKPDASISGQCADRRVVQFTGNFSGVTRFYWDFGDSTALDSINENPLHTYAEFKDYYPSLVIYNDSNRCNPVYDTAKLELAPPPFLRILPPKRELCSYDTLNLHSNASMRYEDFYWIVNGDTISRKKEYELDTVPGLYEIELFTRDYLGCTFSALDTFFVTGLKANFDTTLIDNCFPVDVEFKDISITDTTIAKWYWDFGNGDTSNRAIDTIKYSNENRNTIFLRVENIFGCLDSIEKKNFLQFELLEVDFLNSLSEICAGDSITYRNISDGLNPKYTWNFGDGATLDTNLQYVGHRYVNGGTYTVSLTAIDETGCIRTTTKVDLVKVDNPIVPGFTADTLIANCYPFAVNFQDTSIGDVAKWEWKFGDGANSVFKNPFHNYTSVGMFDVFLKVTTPNGCADSIEKIAYIQTNGPTAEFVFSKDTICINEEVTFNITQSTNVASYNWDFGDGNGGIGNPVNHTYTQKTGKVIVALIVKDTTGNCIVPLEDSLFVYDIYADFSISDDSACVPYEAQFTKQSVGDDTFRWNFGSGNFSNDLNPTFNYQQAGLYQVSLEINSTVGCKDTAFKNIEIFPIPLATASKDTGICVGDSVLLLGSGGGTYAWSPSNSLSSSNTASTIAFPNVSTNYQLIVSNAANCKDTTEVSVFVQQAPSYQAIPDSTIIIGETIQFNANSGAGFTYKWTPNTGLSCPDCPNPIAKPLSNQSYILEIFDKYGCFYFSDTIHIEVIEKYSLDVPNAFSPNGDGSNDFIYVKGWGLKELIAFKIYNRFGELVFESTDFDKGWDGTYKGQPQNIETYVFTVEALTYSGKVLTKKGNISLLR